MMEEPQNQDLQEAKQDKLRKETIRRFVIYGVIGVVVLILTTLVVLVTEGYYFSPDKKSVIHNGLVLVDSRPKSANVVINGHQEKDKTQARFTLPEGKYSFKIWKEGYRDWSKSLNLIGSEVVDMNYVLMIPRAIPTKEIAPYSGKVTMLSQSPDQRWMLVHHDDSPASLDLIDTTTKDSTSTKLELPTTVFTDGTNFNSLEVVQWASDNAHALLSVMIKEQKHFVIFNRTDAAKSIDIGKQVKLDLVKVQLHDDKWDRYYGIDTNADLREFDITLGSISAPKFQKALDFKQYGSDKLIVATEDKDTPTVSYTLSDKFGNLKLSSTAKKDNNHYLLDISEYDGDWYIVAGSQLDNAVIVYKNSFDIIKSRSSQSPKALISLSINDPTDTTFSKSSKFLAIKSGNEYVIYNNEAKKTYRYTLDGVVNTNAKTADWIDSEHLVARSDAHQFLFDYDGLNKQDLGIATDVAPLAFNKSYTQFYGVTSKTNGAQTIVRSSLEVGSSN